MRSRASFVKLSSIAAIIALLVLAGIGGTNAQAGRLAASPTMMGTMAADSAFPPCPPAMDAMMATMMPTMSGTMMPTMMATMKSTMMPTMMATSAFDMMTGCELYGSFNGKAEVPGPADVNATGTVELKISRPASGPGQVCYEIHVTGLAKPVTATHIHKAAAGTSGSVVVPFPVIPDAKGDAIGCAVNVDRALIADILTEPQNYYVNVHNADFPNGAARAQLTSIEPK